MITETNVNSTIPRWVPLFSGMLGSTTVGMLLYAWSVFIKPLNAEFGWSRAEVALAFAICCLISGLVTFPAGRLSDKYGPRLVVSIGGIFLGGGFFLCGFIESKLYLYISYGLICGLGNGLVYLPPIATAPKWWPDRPALATGFAVVGLGLGSFLMGPLATWMIENPTLGWRSVFWYCGIAMGIMAVVAGLLLQLPPAGWKPAGWKPAKKTTGASEGPAAAAMTRDHTHEETKKEKAFWLLWLAYFCGCFAGLMVVGHIAGHGRDSGLSAMAAAGAISALSFSNAGTRVLSGWFVDLIGIKRYFIMVFAIQTVAMLLLYPLAKNYLALWLIAVLIGWNYGAIFTLFPAACLQYFGATAQASNYGLLFSAFGVAGFLGPYVGGYLKDVTGSYSVPFISGSVMCALATLIILFAKPPKKKTV